MEANGQEIFNSKLIGATDKAQAAKGRSTKPNVITSLVEKEELQDGAELWLIASTLPQAIRPSDPKDPRLKVTLKLDGVTPSLEYEPPDHESQTLIPSKAAGAIRKVFEPDYKAADRSTSVHDRFSRDADGPSLGELAVETDAPGWA